MTIVSFHVDPWLYAYMLLSCGVQLWICLGCKRRFPKFIPLIADLGIILLASVVFLPNMEFFGTGMVFYFLIMLGVLLGVCALAFAWLVYGIIHAVHRRNYKAKTPNEPQ